MDRETVLQNILLNYGRYGVTKEEIEPIIDESLEEGRSCDSIYFFLQLAITDVYGLKFFWCTSRQMAKALEISDDDMLEIIKESSKKLDVAEKGLDDYFRVPVEVGEKFFMSK